MARARIQLNGVDARSVITTIGSAVTFSNDDEGGETTYLWSVVDQPEGTNDNLTSPTSETTSLTLTKEGSYQVRLVVNLGLGTEAIQTATVSVLDSKTNERIPAATETIEFSTLKGWAQATNRIFKRVLTAAVDGNLQLARTPGGLSPGAIVSLTGVFGINTGYQSQYETVGIVAALGTTTAPGRLGILVDGISPGDVSTGALVVVRMFGLVPFSGSGAPLVGGRIFLGDTGLPSLSPGTVSRIIGTVVARSGGLYRWTIDGTERPASGGGGASVTLPTDCGDGSSGSFVLDGIATPAWATRSGSVYTLTGNVFLVLLTINVGITLKTDGWSMRMQQAPINNGTIDCSGGDATLNVNGAAAVTGSRWLPVSNSAGTGSTNAPNVFPSSSAAANGVSVGGAGSSGGSAPATSPTAGRGGGSGAGGNSNPFTSQGADGNPSPSVTSVGGTPSTGDIRMYAYAAAGKSAANTTYTLGTWGAVGGDAATVPGGGRGAAGGYIFIACPGIAGSGTIAAKGGNGGNGGPGPVLGNAGSGGGGGGAGGIVILALQGLTCTNTVDVSGGAMGIGGAGNGAGSGGNGQPGGPGADLRL